MLRKASDSLGFFQSDDLRSREIPWFQTLLFTSLEMVRSGIPWWPYGAVKYLGTHLAKIENPKTFEWGSGASTTWLAARTQETVSIEHYANWFSVVSKSGLDSVDLKLIEGKPSEHPVSS
jgi:hypothetical protein